MEIWTKLMADISPKCRTDGIYSPTDLAIEPQLPPADCYV
jgi:hypothetical protein